MYKYIFWLDITMNDVEFIEILESMQKLLEVPQYVILILDLSILMQLGKVALKILIVTVLKDDINAMIFGIANHILNNDDVGISTKFYQIFYLLPCKCNNFIYFLRLLDIVGDANNLKGQFV